MRRPTPLLVLVLALVLALVAAPRAAAAEDPPPLGSFAELEALVQRVETEGFKRFTYEAVKPQIPDAKLVFEVRDNTIDKEKEFRRAWVAAYDAIAKDLDLSGRAAVKQKKSKGAQDALKLLLALAPRLDELKAAKGNEKEVFAAREASCKKFLKRYDFGPRVAQASAQGTAVIDVKLAPDTYELCRRTVYAWKFQPFKDAQGKDVLWGGKRIEFADALSQSDVREGLRMFTNEWFAIRYVKWELEKETDLLRITGAKLLLGTYYFVEHQERIVVAREPVAAR